MSRRRPPLWAAALSALFAVATAMPANDMFLLARQQDTCAPTYNKCNKGNFPANFCCPADTTCMSLAGDTTILCCPSESDCKKIRPIPCDISLQDGQVFPSAVVKTTALTGSLARCGGSCCPFGFTCKDNECVLSADQSKPPAQTNPPRPGPSSTTSRSSAASSPTASSTQEPGATAESQNSSAANGEGGGPNVAVIAGVSVGVAILLIGAAFAAWWFFFRKKKQEPAEPPNGLKLTRSTSSFGNFISNPIMAEGEPARTDFARAMPPPPLPGGEQYENPDSVTGGYLNDSLGTSPGSRSLTGAAAGMRHSSVAYGYAGGDPDDQYGQSGLDASPYIDMPDMPDMAHYGSQGQGQNPFDDNNLAGGLMMPQTPRQHREPSSVSINVFADPRQITPEGSPETGNDRRYTNMTSFSKMMDNADLGAVARGESSYVPYGESPVIRR